MWILDYISKPKAAREEKYLENTALNEAIFNPLTNSAQTEKQCHNLSLTYHGICIEFSHNTTSALKILVRIGAGRFTRDLHHELRMRCDVKLSHDM